MTRIVKVARRRGRERAALELTRTLNYNLAVPSNRISWALAQRRAILALICAPLLAGASCGKKPAKTDNNAVAIADKGSNGSAGSAGVVIPDGPVDSTPLSPAVDLAKLDDTKTQLFYKLVGSLSSPCGKAESLRKSYTSDTSCKRAPFAVKYVIALLSDEASESVAREQYDLKYKDPGAVINIDSSKAPHEGTLGAPVKMVEFFDYGCPHCEEFKPMLEQVINAEGDKVCVYFMNFVLGHFPGSKEAAQTAIAADAQGKFKEMHDMLYAHRTEHEHDQLFGYAKSLNLDMTKFAADYDAAAPHVDADHAAGDSAGVDATPTLYFNSRKYTGPMAARYIEMWVEEEVAVNR